MDKRDWSAMSEAEFEAALKTSLADLPPDEVVGEVTPWRRAMNRVLTGLALNLVTLNFWGLNYILPMVGTLLLLLGFRALRRENPWFRLGWAVMLLRTAYCLPVLILNGTIFQSRVNAAPISRVLAAANLGLNLLLLVCLWRGLAAVRRKAGLPARSGGGAALVAWYGIVCLLAVLEYQGMVLPFVLIGVFILIIRGLLRLSRELDQAGYAVRPAPVKLPDWALAAAVLGVLAAGLVCACLLFGSYPMQWRERESSADPSADQVREQLIELGFPEYVLEDLSGGDVKACEGALRVVVEVNDHSIQDGYNGSDEKQLRITGVGVELPGEQERWKIFHYFQWVVDPGFHGTESIQLWPAYRYSGGWAADGEFTGQVLYDRKGKTYAAPYYSLERETYTSNSIFWGEQTSTDVFAAFSLPNGGEHYRGYLSYCIAELEDGWLVDAWINYTHQRSWMQYPVVTAKEKRMAGGSIHDGAFVTVQDALQFDPNFDELEPLQ